MRQPTYLQELRHIVDVDGQLIGIESPAVRASHLLARAGIEGGRRLALVTDDRELTLGDDQLVDLSEREVLFFRSVKGGQSGSVLLRAA